VCTEHERYQVKVITRTLAFGGPFCRCLAFHLSAAITLFIFLCPEDLVSSTKQMVLSLFQYFFFHSVVARPDSDR
jgi:hypothetical protein